MTSFGNIRGLAPEEPTKEGSYYSGSVAYYGATHDVNSVTGDQKVQTFAVALASPLPRIEIPVGRQEDHARAVREDRGRQRERPERVRDHGLPADQPDRRLLCRYAEPRATASSA